MDKQRVIEALDEHRVSRLDEADDKSEARALSKEIVGVLKQCYPIHDALRAYLAHAPDEARGTASLMFQGMEKLRFAAIQLLRVGGD